MTDRRQEILEKYISLYFSSHHDKSKWNGEGEHGGAEWHTSKAIAADIYNAMDEHAKKMCLEFIDFVVKKTTGHSIDDDGDVDFKYGDDWISKEELFENFL